MSGARRAFGSTEGSSFLASAKATALFRMLSRFVSVCAKTGTVSWYIEIVIAFSPYRGGRKAGADAGYWGTSGIARGLLRFFLGALFLHGFIGFLFRLLLFVHTFAHENAPG